MYLLLISISHLVIFANITVRPKKYKNTDFSGKYECRKYDNTPMKNNYHYVTLKAQGLTYLKYENRNKNLIWKFKPTDDDTVYNAKSSTSKGFLYSNFTKLTFKFSEDGEVIGLFGPGGEFYHKQEKFSDE